MLKRLIAILVAAAAMAAPCAAQAAPASLTVYTHGDSRFAQLQPDGSITGTAPDVLACAMPMLRIPYDMKVLPLSRARTIIDTYRNAVWFPSGHNGNAQRMRRMVGPVDVITVLWYQLKSHPGDPNSEEFRATARVTAYSGSALESELQQAGFNTVPGSADHNRLIYMIMSGEIDALLAIDFRQVLSAETRRIVDERLRVTLQRQVPVSFQLSEHLVSNYPSFVEDMRLAVANCQK